MLSAIPALIYEWSTGGMGGTTPLSVASLNDVVFFPASDSRGRELWRTDGSTAGTFLVKDVNTSSGLRNSNPTSLTVFNEKIFFSADDGLNGTELWVTDGTPSGTVLAVDIRPGGSTGGMMPVIYSSSPSLLTPASGGLYLATADMGTSLGEASSGNLWKLVATPSGAGGELGYAVQPIGYQARAQNTPSRSTGSTAPLSSFRYERNKPLFRGRHSRLIWLFTDTPQYRVRGQRDALELYCGC